LYSTSRLKKHVKIAICNNVVFTIKRFMNILPFFKYYFGFFFRSLKRMVAFWRRTPQRCFSPVVDLERLAVVALALAALARDIDIGQNQNHGLSRISTISPA
jgi:hypothetical protein